MVVCMYDKFAAKHNPRHRTRERTLLLLSALGGSVVRFLTIWMSAPERRWVSAIFPMTAITMVW